MLALGPLVAVAVAVAVGARRAAGARQVVGDGPAGQGEGVFAAFLA